MVDRSTDRTDTFLREVDEELRREQLQKLWNRYGMHVLVLAAMAVLAVGAYNWYWSRAIAAREAAGARFEQAMALAEAHKSEEALKSFAEIAKQGAGGYSTLARFQLAAATAKAGKAEEAVAAYEAIAKDTSVDELMQGLATLKAAMLRLDGADWTEMENRLRPLLTEKSAWRAMARETLGVAAYKAGKTAEARKLFEDLLSDRTAPHLVNERAMLMLSLLTDADADKGTVMTQPAAATNEDAKGGVAPERKEKTKAPIGQKK